MPEKLGVKLWSSAATSQQELRNPERCQNRVYIPRLRIQVTVQDVAKQLLSASRKGSEIIDGLDCQLRVISLMSRVRGLPAFWTDMEVQSWNEIVVRGGGWQQAGSSISCIESGWMSSS